MTARIRNQTAVAPANRKASPGTILLRIALCGSCDKHLSKNISPWGAPPRFWDSTAMK